MGLGGERGRGPIWWGEERRGERPLMPKSYRCPWCERLDTDQEKAQYHSLICRKKNKTIWSFLKDMPDREVKKIVKRKEM